MAEALVSSATGLKHAETAEREEDVDAE